MCIEAKKPPLTDEAVDQFLNFLGTVLARDEPFSVLWNVQGGAFPSMAQFRRVIAWLDEEGHCERWDGLVQGNVAVIRSPLLRGAVRVMKAIANPPQPSHVCSTEHEALTFAADTFREARSYVTSREQE